MQGDWEQRSGSPEKVAEAVAKELDAEYDPARVQEMLASYGP